MRHLGTIEAISLCHRFRRVRQTGNPSNGNHALETYSSSMFLRATRFAMYKEEFLFSLPRFFR